MRIAIFSESFEPVQNGVSTSVRILMEELRNRKHNVFLVAPKFPNYIDVTPFIMRVPSIRTPFNADYPLPYPWFPMLRKRFGKTGPDVIHAQHPWALGLLAARLALRDNKPFVATYHTHYDHYGHYLFFLPKPAVDGVLEWWIPEFYNRCECVIVPSRNAEESLRGYGVESRIMVIPTGVELPDLNNLTTEVKAKVRQHWNIPATAPFLLYVGRLAQEKNVELVLQAFEQVHKQLPQTHLLIVGGGPYLDELTALSESLKSSEHVRFAGPIPRDELDPIYAAADIFVFTSVTETQGLVISEARAAGTPCVVVDQGGAPENVRNGEDGLIVSADTEAVVGAIMKLLTNPELLGRMSENCRRNAWNHTPGIMADRVLDVYRWAIWKREQRNAADGSEDDPNSTQSTEQLI